MFWALMALFLVSCDRFDDVQESGRKYIVNYGEGLTHDKIVLGNRLDNPYKTSNVKKALASLYPTKADGISLSSTDLYVRFLPKSDEQMQALSDAGIELVDHPLDYEIKVEGDWYHDPELKDDDQTWQYAVLPRDASVPDGIYYELIDECFIPDNSPSTKALEGIDWDAVEREAYLLTGNESMLLPETKASKAKVPSGRITIIDKDSSSGKEIGVAGVRITCNSFVRMNKCYTDRDGYYKMKSKFTAKLRYRLVFKNEKGFSIGFNTIFTPASVSTLGKAGPEGMYFTVTDQSEEKLFRRCVVNNSAYDYYLRCDRDDMNITLPPSDLRIWIFPSMSASSATMLHHGTILSDIQMGKFWGYCLRIVKYFLPDITIGTKKSENYASIYSSVCHELAHASHFSQVGKDYWNKFIYYIMSSYVQNSDVLYGDGTGEGAGHCSVGEMWAYYLSSVMFKDRYGGAVPPYGNSNWFHPQIFRYLEDRGVTRNEIFSTLQKDVTSEDAVKYALIAKLPHHRAMIEQVFNRYR